MAFARSLALIIPVLFMFQLPVSAAPERPLSIAITLETFEADVLWNASEQYVNFNGTVTLDDPASREIDVSLFTSAPAGWSARCSPDIIKFHSAGDRSFTCNVHIGAVRGNMTGNITIDGVAYWRGDVMASNQSPVFFVHVTRLPVEKFENLSNPHKLDFTTRLENVLPHILGLSASAATVAVSVLVWRRRRRRKARPTNLY